MLCSVYMNVWTHKKTIFRNFMKKKMLGFLFLSNLKTLIFSTKKNKKKTIKNRKNRFSATISKTNVHNLGSALLLVRRIHSQLDLDPILFFFASSDLWTRFWFFPKTTQDTFFFFFFFLIFSFQFFFFRVCAGLRDEHINIAVSNQVIHITQKKLKTHKKCRSTQKM